MCGKWGTRLAFGVLHTLFFLVVAIWMGVNIVSETLPNDFRSCVARWATLAGFLISAVTYYVQLGVHVDREKYSPLTWVRWFLAVPAFTVALTISATDANWAWVSFFGVLAISFYLQYAQSVNEEMNSEIKGELDELEENKPGELKTLLADKDGNNMHTAGVDPHWTSFGQATIAFVLLTIFVILFAVKTATPLGSATMWYFYAFQVIYFVFHVFGSGSAICCSAWSWDNGDARVLVFAVALAALGVVPFVANFIHPTVF